MKYYNNTNKLISIKLPRFHNGLLYPANSVRKVKPGEKIMIADGLLDYNEIPQLIASGDLSLEKKDKDVKPKEVKKDKKDKDKKSKDKKKINKKKK